jgi:selenoprotein W-related protein
MKPTIIIEYCPKCNWLMRAAWYAQELLTTFEDELMAISLKPSETAGKFEVLIEEKSLFDRKTEGRFPDAKELKQLLRDEIAPEKSLGHSEKLRI